MKGLTKALQRTPHMMTSKIGMAKKSTDPEYLDYERKFAAIEAASEKMLKDSTVFRDSVQTLLLSGSSFSGSLAVIFSPMGSEYNLSSKFPQSEVTLNSITQYQTLMEEMRETLAPELELIDSRIVQPCKELHDICKKIRKTCVKRDHKLVDFDRHNNALGKLRDKKEKSLKDEQNLFKYEQDFELAAGEYEHYNDLLKAELPQFLQLGSKFINPLFHSFYYMQLNVFYIMLEKVQSFADGKYDLTRKDIENIYLEQRGDAAEQLEELQVTKKGALHSTAKLRQMAGVGPQRSASGKGSMLDRKTSGASTSTYASRKAAEAYGGGAGAAAAAGGAGSSRIVAAPPPYTSTPSSDSIGKKKAPPPPPPLKSKPSYGPAKVYCTALYDYEAQAAGDLSFSAGERIEIVERTDSAEDWWTGKAGGRQGIFPGNYTQLD